MYIKIIAFLLLYTVVGPISTIAQTTDTENTRPNIVIFLADDQGYGDLPLYGHPIIQTPHLDRFAEEGVLFTDMHAAATVCSPARASLLTGRNAYRSGYYNIAGFFGSTFQRDEITIAHLLQDGGYDTAFFGKWHLSRLESEDEVSVNDMGFDYSFATSVNAFEGPQNPEKFMRNGVPVGNTQGWYIDLIVEDASEWLANREDSSKPFFMIIGAHEPHTPVEPPEEFSAMYDNEETERLAQEIRLGGYPRPERDLSQYRKEYYGTVTLIDAAFGNFLEILDSRGLKDNTLVVFTSDNGPEYPVTLAESGGRWHDPLRDRSHGTPGELRGMKRFAYEGGHRVPGLARWPGYIPEGIVSDKLFNGTDFMPTIASLAGISIPDDRTIDGTNAFNAFLNKEYTRELPPLWLFLASSSHLQGMSDIAMRYEDYVLIARLSPDRGEFFHNQENTNAVVDWVKTAMPTKFELYNIKKDIEQKHDLAKEEYDILMKLIPIMQRRWIDIRDDGPWWGRME